MTIVMLITAATPANAGQFEDGNAAYQQGDYQTAFRIWRPCADEGRAGCEFMLGLLYSYGKGVPINRAEAFKWYKRAALRPDPIAYLAQVNVGLAYIEGAGVPIDFDLGVSWLRKAADRGYANAQFSLGDKYFKAGDAKEREKKDPAQDYLEALKWYRLAADQGYADGQIGLGLMFEKGRGVPQDYTEALRWYRKAADQGNADGQLSLGLMYEDGHGVPQDYAEAAKWLRKSADQGNSLAQHFLELIYAKAASAAAANSPAHAAPLVLLPAAHADTVPLENEGGIYVVPVLINDAITLKFILDTGASDVLVPADVVSTLIRTGTVKKPDFIGTGTYLLADGSRLPSAQFIIRELKVGDHRVSNVVASIAPAAGSLLLGQSFLSRLPKWSIDYDQRVLVIGDRTRP